VVSSFSVSLSYALQPVSSDTYTFSLNLCDCYRNAFRHHLKKCVIFYFLRFCFLYHPHVQNFRYPHMSPLSSECQLTGMQIHIYMNTVYECCTKSIIDFDRIFAYRVYLVVCTMPYVLYYDRDCLTYTDEIFYPMLKHVSYFQQTVDSSL